MANKDIEVRPYKYRRGFLPYHDTFRLYLIPISNSDDPEKYGKDLTTEDLQKFGVKPILLGEDNWHDPSENGANYAMAAGAGALRAAPYIAEGLNWFNSEVAPYMTARGQLALRGANAPSWLTPTSATAIDAALAGITTGASINDMRENGPTVGNVLGTALGVGGLAYEAIPTVMEGYSAARNTVRPYILASKMNSSLKSTQMPPELQPIRTNFNFGKGSGRVIRADKGDGKGAFTGTGAYIKDGFLYPGKTRSAGLRDFTWWNEDELFSPGFRTKPFLRVFIANKSDIPGLLRVREMNEPVGLWRPGSRKAFVRDAEMVTAEPTDVSNLTQYNYDPHLGYVRSDIPTHNLLFLLPRSQRAKLIFSERPSTLTQAERAGIPKGERNQITEDLLQALEDLMQYKTFGLYRNKFTINPTTNLAGWTREVPEGNVSFIKEALQRGHPRNGRGGIYYITTDNGTIGFNPELRSTVYTSKLPEEWGGWGETYLGTVNGKTNRMVLTAPRTDQGGTNLNLPETLDKNIMKDFWINGRAITKPGTYITGDEKTYPIGHYAIEEFKLNGIYPALSKILYPGKYPKRLNMGLSPDSYSAIIRQALRDGSALRWGEGFYNWNPSAVENKYIYDAFRKFLKKQITLDEYTKIFNDWAIPLGGRPLQYMTRANGEVLPVHPHPFIYIKKQGGQLIPKNLK